MQLEDYMLEPLSGLINHLLSLDPDSTPRLNKIEGVCAEIEVAGFDYRVHLLCRAGKIELKKETQEVPAVIIRGAPLSLLRMIKVADPAELLQTGEIEMQGDVQQGRQIKAVFEHLDIDWEEWVSRFIGDIPAHYLGSAARGFLTWQDRSLDAVAASIGEYLQEEVQQLPTRIEIENWMDEVDELRASLDRIEARINIAEQALSRKTSSL